MTDTKSFDLADSQVHIIDSLIASGRYRNGTEVIEAGLQILQEYESKMDHVRELVDLADYSIANGKGSAYSTPHQASNAILAKGKERLIVGQ